MTTVPIALVQHPPVFLNLRASVARAVELIADAARKGARVVSFPECWLPGYPVWVDFAPRAAIWDEVGAKQLYRHLAKNAVVLGDEHLALIQQAADHHEVFVVMGTHERKGGTLYNTSFLFSPGLNEPVIHRKLVPTYTERLIWGRGDGSTLNTVDTPWGPLGVLICWEHWMPEARIAMHKAGEILHIAQWPIVKDMHQVASRHYAFEGSVPVAAVGSLLRYDEIVADVEAMADANDLRAGIDLLKSMQPETAFVHNGGSMVVDASGDVLVAPQFDTQSIITADISLDTRDEALLTFDSTGHYSRPDVFELTVDRRVKTGISNRID
ncbi:MAG: carbon-nitrogen hydrolase family protein [Pseudomonadota bacterium]